MFLVLGQSFAAEVEAPPMESTIPPQDTNARQLLHAVLQLEGQLRSNQLAFEQNNLDLRLAAIRSTETLSNGLQTIEKALSAQQEAFSIRRAQEFETMQDSNHTMIVVAGAFTGIACLALVGIAFFQWRMNRIWAGISTSLPMSSGLGPTAAVPALGSGKVHLVGTGAVESANVRLIGALERLERRVQELEQTSEPDVEPQARGSVSGDNGNSGAGNGEDSAGVTGQGATHETSEVRVLLRQGQLMLKEQKVEAALTCFDEVLSLSPNHSEALVKKGVALERLHKLNEAFECYDQAISADGSLTMAYLYKGGLCSRLERFKEALECYEKALQTHDEAHS